MFVYYMSCWWLYQLLVVISAVGGYISCLVLYRLVVGYIGCLMVISADWWLIQLFVGYIRCFGDNIICLVVILAV